MRSRFAATLSALTLALTFAIPATALAADKTGSEGIARTINVNAQSSDAYLQYHGRLFLSSSKTTTEYRWGGTSCGSRTMSAENVQLLLDLVRSGDEVRVTPTYQDGQGQNTKCLVGFSVKYHKARKSH